MIILTSNGITDITVKDKIIKYTKSRIKTCALITTASVEYKNNDKHIDRHLQDLISLGITTKLIDIEFENSSNLLEFDSIMINGGNPFYLNEQIRNSGTDKILKTFEENAKLIIGVSAGSVVLGQSLELIDFFEPELANVCEKKYIEGLKLTSVNICPHFSRLSSKFMDFEDRFLKLQRSSNNSYVILEDGEVVFI